MSRRLWRTQPRMYSSAIRKPESQISTPVFLNFKDNIWNNASKFKILKKLNEHERTVISYVLIGRNGWVFQWLCNWRTLLFQRKLRWWDFGSTRRPWCVVSICRWSALVFSVGARTSRDCPDCTWSCGGHWNLWIYFTNNYIFLKKPFCIVSSFR